MNGYNVGPPGGEAFGQPIIVAHEGGPGVEVVQWNPEGMPAHVAFEHGPGVKVVVFENGPPPGTGYQGPTEAEKWAATQRGATTPTVSPDLAQVHLLLLM